MFFKKCVPEKNALLYFKVCLFENLCTITSKTHYRLTIESTYLKLKFVSNFDIELFVYPFDKILVSDVVCFVFLNFNFHPVNILEFDIMNIMQSVPLTYRYVLILFKAASFHMFLSSNTITALSETSNEIKA